MAVTETDIANQALIMIGSTPINSLNDASNQGIACKTLYYPARDGLLREIPWNFARKQVALNQLATVPVNLNLLPNTVGPGNIVWTGAFALPLDFLRMYRFSPQNAHWRLISFPLAVDPQGNPTGFGLAVITDATPAPVTGPLFGTQPTNADGSDDLPGGIFFPAPVTQLGCEYIAKIIDPGQFDSLFVECLAAKLASQIAQAITGLPSVAQGMMQTYKDRLADAAAVNGMENWADQMYNLAVIDVRYGYTGTGITAGS